MFQFKLADRTEVAAFIEENHYSHSINGVKSSYCFAIYESDVLVGAALFGAMSTTAWKKFGTSEKDVVELRRLVLTENCPRNSESWFISRCLKWLRQNTSIKTVVSYADPYHGHMGYVYQASNWEYIGVSGKDKGFVDVETGKTYHSRALRTKYNGDYKPFVKKLREKLEKGILVPRDLPGKHTYVFNLRKKNLNKIPYPKSS